MKTLTWAKPWRAGSTWRRSTPAGQQSAWLTSVCLQHQTHTCSVSTYIHWEHVSLQLKPTVFCSCKAPCVFILTGALHDHLLISLRPVRVDSSTCYCCRAESLPSLRSVNTSCSCGSESVKNNDKNKLGETQKAQRKFRDSLWKKKLLWRHVHVFLNCQFIHRWRFQHFTAKRATSCSCVHTLGLPDPDLTTCYTEPD